MTITTKNTNIPNLYGLILIGGKSKRMGVDKSELNYHGKSQKKHVYELLNTIIESKKIYYSVRDNDQLKNTKIIIDAIAGLGPFGGIYSAFLAKSNKAWFTIAIDLPLVDKHILNILINKRNPSKIATTFIGKNKKYPEPLITIWEPKSFPILKNQLSRKQYSLSKILHNNNVEIIEIDEKWIQNSNTKKTYKSILKKI